MFADEARWRRYQQAHEDARYAAEQRHRKESEREIVTQHAQRWLKELSRDLPGVVTGDDAAIRRLAEQVAAVVLG